MNKFIGHIETLAPYFFRKVSSVDFQTKRLPTPDDDFIDVDYLINDSFDSLVFICHGLEGSSRQPYVKGVAKYFFERGVNVVAMNYRSCSGELNVAPRFYHSGETSDLQFCLDWAKRFFSPKKIFMTGFSLGGNLITKYFGENGDRLDTVICGGAVFSAPLDLAGGSQVLNEKFNKLYEQNFLMTLKSKVIKKKRLGIITDEINILKVIAAKSIYEFDELVTAPLHGFSGADDYYQKNSGLHFIDKVKRPLYIANAANDPILSEKSFFESGQVNDYVYFNKLNRGGHVGFIDFNFSNEFLAEKLAFEFFQSLN